MARERGPESNLVPEQREAADSAGRHTPLRGLVKGLGREGQRGGRELQSTISSLLTEAHSHLRKAGLP